MENLLRCVLYDLQCNCLLICVHVSVCDVLPHLLASENMTVDITYAKSTSSQDDEVCGLFS